MRVGPKRTRVKCELKQGCMKFGQKKRLDKNKDKGEFRTKNKGKFGQLRMGVWTKHKELLPHYLFYCGTLLHSF